MTKVLAESGAELSHEELLDALWLARKLPPNAGALARAAGVAAEPAERDGGPDLDGATGPEAEAAQGGAGAPEPAAEESTEQRPAHGLRGAARSCAAEDRQAPAASSSAMAVRTPESRPLGPRELRLGKSLRPLRQRFPDRRREELDLTRTVAAMADTGVPETVTGPVRTRWMSLALVIDDGVSMILWQRLAADVRALMERAGTFRNVRVYGLDTRGATPALRTGPYRHSSHLLSPRTLCDPTGNTLVLIVSDGVGTAWRDGGMRAVTDRWGGCGPTAIVQVLPSRLWAGTGIDARLWQVTTHQRGGPTRAWHVTDPDLPPELVRFDSVPVPVLAPVPESVADWATLIASPGGTALLPLWEEARPGAGRPVADTRGDDAAEAVLRFRAAASAEAYRLAAHVAAVAPVTPPVMRLVQAALGPPTDPGHLMEVFLGGLMHELHADGPDRLPHHRRFDFPADARRVLLSAVSPKELLRTTEVLTQNIEAAVGRAPVFPAWVGHPDGAARIDDTGRSFGWLREQLLKQLGIPSADTGPAAAVPARPPEDDVRAPADHGTGQASDGPARETLPTGWVELLPEDPSQLGEFRLRARSARGWHHLTMYLAEGEDGTIATVRAPVALHARDPEAARVLVRTEAECLKRMRGTYAPALLDVALPTAGGLPWVAASCVHHHADDPSSPPAPNLRSVLESHGGPVPWRQFLRIGTGLAEAVAFAHAQGLVHGSLAPRSVLVTDHGVRVVGWATATIDGVDSAYRHVLPVSDAYLENEDPPGGALAPEVDVYAVGAVLLAFLSGRWSDPRADSTGPHLLDDLGIAPPLLRTLRRCLEYDPALRPSAAALAEAFALASGGPAADRVAKELDVVTAEDIRRMRELVRQDFGSHGLGFARLLRTFSNQTASRGQHETSLAAARESVEVHRELLSLEDSPMFSAGLAMALSNLSVRLAEGDPAGENLDAASEAETVYRELRARDSELFGAGHAMTLNNLSNRLAAAGRREEALQAIEEAVRIGRGRVKLSASAASSDLARSLTNLGRRLGDLGRQDEARTAAAEAVEIYHGLPTEEARRVWADCAASLNNLAILLGEEGRLDDALTMVDTSLGVQERYRSKRSQAASELHEWSGRVRTWLEDLSG
ncbi:protein kinase family protein [Streptomyces sp. NRRL F-4428]|uniref:protein kinase family protein n=1 Tax=Streptomyces sp. NRRL F-4428 TaxID=1609137 RepID=UPI00131E3A22|nr:protein kinase family protein [Streptomyces sp. NRRL F-4428]